MQRIIRCQSAARLSAGLTQGLRGRVCLDWAGLCWRSAWPGRGLPIQVSSQSELGITRLDQSEASIRIKPPSGLAMAGGGQWPLCPAAPGTEPRQAAAPCPAGAAARRDCQEARPMSVTSSSLTAPPLSTTTLSPARVCWTWRRVGDPPPSDPDPDL